MVEVIYINGRAIYNNDRVLVREEEDPYDPYMEGVEGGGEEEIFEI